MDDASNRDRCKGGFQTRPDNPRTRFDQYPLQAWSAAGTLNLTRSRMDGRSVRASSLPVLLREEADIRGRTVSPVSATLRLGQEASRSFRPVAPARGAAHAAPRSDGNSNPGTFFLKSAGRLPILKAKTASVFKRQRIATSTRYQGRRHCPTPLFDPAFRSRPMMTTPHLPGAREGRLRRNSQRHTSAAGASTGTVEPRAPHVDARGAVSRAIRR